MTTRHAMTFALILTPLLTGNAVGADPARVDAPAPGFTLKSADGKSRSLSDFRGKYVVLEWVNFDCPFVRKHYGSGAMQRLQRTTTGEGIAWLSICSSAPGKQGYFEGDGLRKRIKEEGAAPTAYLVDTDGTVGRLYDAKTTPHMFVIDPKGILIYAGGIDNIASTDKDDIARATNYVNAALEDARAGRTVAVKNAKSYGCSVKYK